MKLGGSNNPAFPLYVELVHQDNARVAGLEVGNYWANGPVGSPAEIAAVVTRTGQVRSGETFWWDVEDWPEEGVIRWSPAEVEARALALRDAGKPLTEQGIYLNQSLADNGGYREVIERLGMRLWLAAYTSGQHVLIKGGWTVKPALWQYTSSNLPELRGIYDANLDVNRAGENVWLVHELQAALNTVIDAGLTVDNEHGDATRDAVYAFQKFAGLFPDGIAGNLTLTDLAGRIA